MHIGTPKRIPSDSCVCVCSHYSRVAKLLGSSLDCDNNEGSDPIEMRSWAQELSEIQRIQSPRPPPQNSKRFLIGKLTNFQAKWDSESLKIPQPPPKMAKKHFLPGKLGNFQAKNLQLLLYPVRQSTQSEKIDTRMNSKILNITLLFCSKAPIDATSVWALFLCRVTLFDLQHHPENHSWRSLLMYTRCVDSITPWAQWSDKWDDIKTGRPGPVCVKSQWYMHLQAEPYVFQFPRRIWVNKTCR